MSRYLLLLMGIVYSFVTQAQNVAINNNNASANASAILDVQSTTKGMLAPRMTKAQKNAIATPATGLLVYQLSPDSIGFHYYDGTQWVWLSSASQVGWLTLGNTGTDPNTNFLGTIDNQALSFRQNNIWSGRWNSATGNYFIGDSAGVQASDKRNIGIGSNALKSLSSGYDNVAIGDSAMKLSNGQTSEAIGSKALMNSSTGAFGNSAIGYESMYSTTTGTFNVAHGFRALKANRVGIENTALGVGALESDTSGSYNTAIGRGSLFLNKKGIHNTGVGWASLYYNDSLRNTAMGSYSLHYNNRNNNTAFGYAAGYLNNYLQTTDGDLGLENVYMGYASGYYANTGSKNVGLGFRALQGQGYFNYDAPGNGFYKRNVAIGDSAMTYSYGSDNVAVGFKALSISTSTSQHVAVGSRALNNTTSTYPNTAIGYLSQDSTTIGGANTSLGSYSLSFNKTGYNNTALGNAAMYEATGNNVIDNTAVGNDALRLTTAQANTGIGAGALRNNTTGIGNVALGWIPMYLNDSSSFNVAVGYSALYNHRRPAYSYNVAIGTNAMYYDTVGYYNVAVGGNALQNNISGSGNIAIGTNSMFSHKYNYNNTSVGYENMFYDTAGINNVAMGWRTLKHVQYPVENVALGVGALEFNDSCNYNVAVGRGAMIAKGGTFNTSLGHFASGFGSNVPTSNYIVTGTTNIGAYAGWKNIGDENTFVGYASGFGGSVSDSLRGLGNTAVGSWSYYLATTGVNNSVFGYRAMFANTTGNANVAMGIRALYSNNSGSYNIAIGDSAMFSGTASTRNVAIGSFALRNAGNGYQNVAIGDYAMTNNTGYRSVGIGDSALAVNTFSQSHVAIGSKALKNSTSASFWNTAVGVESQTSMLSGYGNASLGYYSLRANIDGYDNTAIGTGSLEKSLSGISNTAVGRSSMFAGRTGNYNVAVGVSAMDQTDSADYATAVGFNAAYYNNRDNITAVGSHALFGNSYLSGSLTEGIENTAVGYYALGGNTRGSKNTALGHYALFSNLSGNDNVSVGDSAGYSFATSFSTAIGSGALKNAALTGNTALGYHSSYNITSGTYNTSVGSNSLEGNQNGSFNTALGYDADVAGTSFTNATAIGYKALAGQNNSLVLGSINGLNGATSNTNVGVNTSTPDSVFSVSDNFLVGSNGTVQYDNNTPTMMYMFKSGGANASRMVISHSPSFPGYGLQYTDANDRFSFLSNWNNVMTMDLSLNRVGIGTPSPSSARLVLKGSANTNATLAMQVVNSDSSNILVADNGRFVAVARVPDYSDVSRGVLQVQGVGSQDLFGLYNAANTNRWTYYTSTTDLLMYNNGALRGTWSAANGVYTSSSDRRLKKDIGLLPDGVLGKLMKIPAYSFRYLDNKGSDDLSIGFMAQDVEPYFPEAVTKITDKDGSEKLGIKYQYFSTYTVKAIQEQQRQIETISEENKTLKAENEQLKKDIELIKKKLGIN